MAISEKVELLGKGLYSDIPDTITLKDLPTASELDYIGSEDFEATMLDKIFPQIIEEKFDYHKLLEIDYQWICRCSRILSYGPYYTTNRIFCDDCNTTSNGEYRVNLTTLSCKTLPEGFVNDIVISKDEFIDFDKDIHLKLPTIQQMRTAYIDKAFQNANGRVNRAMARMCYMITSVGQNKNLTPIELKLLITRDFSSADYIILKNKVNELTDYGLRAGGSVVCPNCGSHNAVYIALVDDRFFRPTMGDLQQWRDDRSSGAGKNLSGDKTAAV